MAENFDLLGEPIPEGFGKRGRPEHRPTDEKRRLVMQLQAFDWSQERIAAALSTTPPTLRKHYFRELRAKDEARARVNAALLINLWREVEAGNVSANDKYFKRLEKHDLAQLAAKVAGRGDQAPATTGGASKRKLGKKEQRAEDAGAVSGKFAPPPAPKLFN